LEEDSVFEKLKPFHGVFFMSFTDPATVPGDPYLKYRGPTYEPEDDNLTEEMNKTPYSIIAVS
jgi:hypothetical protein